MAPLLIRERAAELKSAICRLDGEGPDREDFYGSLVKILCPQHAVQL